MTKRSILAMALLCACGPKPAAKHEPTEPPEEKPVVVTAEPRVALASVPAAALGRSRAASYLVVSADGALAIGALDATGEVNVSSLTPTPTEIGALTFWSDPSDPPIPTTPGEDQGPWGTIVGTGDSPDADIYGGLIGTTEATVTTTRCGTALHLDPALDGPSTLLIADARADALVVLAALDQMPRPVALLARGEDPRGLALRLVVDGHVDITSSYQVPVPRGSGDAAQVRDWTIKAAAVADVRAQTFVTIDEGATAQDLFAVLAGLALADVHEVVLDLGATCTTTDLSGGFGYGTSGTVPGGDGEDDGGGGTGYGTIGHGNGTGMGHNPEPKDRVARIPKMTLDKKVKVKGRLDDAIVRRYIRMHRSKLLYCYEKHLLSKPGIEGKAKAKFEIDAQGAVSSASVDGFDADVDACLEGVLLGIEFPKPKRGTVTVTTKWTFAPTGG